MDFNQEASNRDKHYFQLKGKSAEEAVTALSFKSFLQEWCYPNPKGRNGKEICDLLVCFDDVVLIIQVKNIAFSGNDERYFRKAFEDPKRQMLGAERQLFESGQALELINLHGHKYIFEPKRIREIYRVVLSMGDGEVPYPGIDISDGKIIHLFDQSIEVILNELDTMTDFTQYMEARRTLFTDPEGPHIFAVSETDLLGEYILNNRSFDHLRGYTDVVCSEGMWEEVVNRKEFKEKKYHDRISYFWDHLIDVTHTCIKPGHREIARELSRTTRFERRCLAISFMSAHDKALSSGCRFRRCLPYRGVTYVFAILPKDYDRVQRQTQLNNICIVARNAHPENSRVLGISTEIDPHGCHTYDFFLLDFPEWSIENQELAISLQKQYEILTDVEEVPVHFDEYPKVNKAKETSYPCKRPIGKRLPHGKVGRNEKCPCGSGLKYKKCCGK